MKPRYLTAMAVLAASWLVAACGSTSSGHGTYRVAAIFDNASFVTPDVDVRIAGARVGQVTGLSVTRDHKARVEMEIDADFAPFHDDADCTIQPQSLISERFINCTPGTSASPVVPDRAGTPTLGLQGTHAPVDIDQVLNTFKLPVRQRLTLLLDGLGVGLTARGEDLNSAIRRAAPALQATHDTLAILDADRRRLQRLISGSDTVLQSLAAGRGRVADFVRQAGVVAATSGARQQRLAAAVRDLPALLGQAQPSLDRLTRFATLATPFTRDLQRAAPGLQQLVTQLKPFARQATPTLVRLGETARKTSTALPDIAPQVRRLGRFADAAAPAGKLTAELFTSFRDRGTLEALQGFTYYAASAVARFDKNSHYLPAYLLGASPCIVYARVPTAGCDAHFAASREGILRAARNAARAERRPSRAHRPPAAGSTSPDGRRPAESSTPPVPPAAAAKPQLPPVLDQLPQALKGLLGALGGGKQSPPATPLPAPAATKDLLEYLLG